MLIDIVFEEGMSVIEVSIPEGDLNDLVDICSSDSFFIETEEQITLGEESYAFVS